MNVIYEANEHLNMPYIGIGITTTPNRNYLDTCMPQWMRYLPSNAYLVVVEDTEYQGISRAKNELLARLKDCQHIFLADDDTYPIVPDWYTPYIESPEPHLQYNFTRGPSHWYLETKAEWDGHKAYDKSRGCMLYIDSSVLPIVGGMHNVYGKHGHEHENWSDRIHAAGLTTYPHQSVKGKHFYCMDEDLSNISSVDFSKHKAWQYIHDASLPIYAEYLSQRVPIMVARRDDGAHRDRLWRFLKKQYWLNQDNVSLPFEGYHIDGPFNRSLGLNIAANMAGNWDVGVFIDSDAYIDPARLEEAIRIARATQKVVAPFDTVVELNKDTTLEILESGRLEYNPSENQIDKIRTQELSTQSLIIVVPRNIYEQIGGFDPHFVGWGGEDNAFWRAAEIVSGEVLRMNGSVFHLWHEPASREYQPSNNARWLAYANAQTREQLNTVRAK